MVTHATVDEAERAFYQAFGSGDLQAMMAVWDQTEICCIHPMGETLTHRQAIADSWQRIFDAARMMVEAHCVQEHASEELVVRVTEERIQTEGGSRGLVLATNVYRRTEGGWRLALHHASPPARSGDAPTAEAVVH